MIYLKRVTRKLDKYIEDKMKENIKKLEANILKNITSNSVSKNTRSY